MKYEVGDVLRYCEKYRTDELDCIIKVTKVMDNNAMYAKILESVGGAWNEKWTFNPNYFEPYNIPPIEDFL